MEHTQSLMQMESTSLLKEKKLYFSNLIFYAGTFLKRIEDKEDAVQNAHLLYLIYKDNFKTGTQEQILKWLVKQECFKILKYKKQWRNKVNYIEDLPFQYSEDRDFSNIEENMHAYTLKCNYNEAPQEIDKQILEIELSKFKTFSDKTLVSKVKNNYVNDVQFKEKRVFSTQLIKQCGRKKRYYRITT